MFKLKACPKKYTKDLDKAFSPEHTVKKAENALKKFGQEILFELKRIDTGRLGIPVYMSICGPKAKKIMPSRKQMGKGSSPEQAKASALMELVERFSFFNFVQEKENFFHLTYSEAKNKFGEKVIPIKELLKSVQDNLSPSQAIEILDLIKWDFTLALKITTEEETYLPFNWFKLLNEYNGSSAGNTFEESILQGACELIERHVCALIEGQKQICPTIDPTTFTDQTLLDLWNKFTRQGIKVWLKDFSYGFPVPTIAALAYDPSTFPYKSEIVFTAGTSTSPAKAAIRALTEVAQLGGDFSTNSTYEPSGLAKYTSLEDVDWVMQGEFISLNCLPSLEADDIYNELKSLASALEQMGYTLYAISTMHPNLNIPTNYNIIPGFAFRERTSQASLGLFVGRLIAENEPPEPAWEKLNILEKYYPNAHFIPFFKGLILLKLSEIEQASKFFQKASKIQPQPEEQALSLFYWAYSLSLEKKWSEIPSILTQAISLVPDVKEYHNLIGVAYFKQKDYSKALTYFEQALSLDSGSAIDLANIGICYKHLGDKENAKFFLKKALELEPHLDFAQKELNSIV
ncbi:YcaO-like family protein [Desulfonauticus submarinus]